MKAHLRKVKELFKLGSIKTLMSIMHDIKAYTENSFKYGLLDLPFLPTPQQIERGLTEMLK